ncbi:hypothetical protein [Streptomyces sp. NPDC052042]|uniref:hypothetical protein n=1 Tax=Streptomyces sp. NPDC052042 TaxID=3365683 RepID=UPI0037D0B49F
MLTFGTVAILGSYAAGVLSDRIGGRGVMALCLVWVTACLLVLPLANGSFPRRWCSSQCSPSRPSA